MTAMDDAVLLRRTADGLYVLSPVAARADPAGTTAPGAPTQDDGAGDPAAARPAVNDAAAPSGAEGTPGPRDVFAVPSVLDAEPGVDVAVLTVAGGQLTWSVLGTTPVACAVLDDVDLAQHWVWALYGEQVAVALGRFAAESGSGAGAEVDAGAGVASDVGGGAGSGSGVGAELDSVAGAEVDAGGAVGPAGSADPGGGSDVLLAAVPAQPGLAARARRLAFAQWASRWWPASTIDDIPALDQTLLAREIGDLIEECDLLFASADTGEAAELIEDVLHPDDLGDWAHLDDLNLTGFGDVDGPVDLGDSGDVVTAPARAEDYALAAGPVAAEPAGGLVLARGSGGSDWRHCPPGLLDAAESAVSWELVRVDARTVVVVSVVAAPGLTESQRAEVPEHLTPHAVVMMAATARDRPDTDSLDVTLRLVSDTWVGQAVAQTTSTAPLAVEVCLPGFGAAKSTSDDVVEPGAGGVVEPGAGGVEPRLGSLAEPGAGEESARAVRDRVRALVRHRLARADPADAAGTAGEDVDAPLLAELAVAEQDF
ncbi:MULTISPECIES: hypothetical protein [Actinoalloteichus]|uniref:Uncharacterized protein n=1 Tax=Actinoalloteichus fjordicus TaxID=1612552 RepID=A0AAC9LF46_9PSEU|nr:MULTISPECIES: hypothetical protein [Actinoalloteichus]APU15705.1 hypothetical protein UA74_18385 [Actinoalloteichus fjordicus]APU21765.1 hypothetical protein UA75_18875 [Actinoalloteichus sp. GBA129-24]